MLLGAPSLTTRNKKLMTTRSKDATSPLPIDSVTTQHFAVSKTWHLLPLSMKMHDKGTQAVLLGWRPLLLGWRP